MSNYYRKVIRIKATDSPNVKLAMGQIARGLPVTHTIVIPGVLPYADYVKRLAVWDSIRKCIGLDGMFYEGAELLLFPPQWLNAAEKRALTRKRQQEEIWMGIDSGEGGDDSCWCVIDRLGILDLISYQTPDTTVVVSQTLGLMRQYDIPPENVWFDRGGGGKEHADRLRKQDLPVNTIGFGESVSLPVRVGTRSVAERVEVSEERYAYKNMRGQMYGRLSILLDPSNQPGFAIPEEYAELRRQLAMIPKMYDNEGRLVLPSKKRKNKNDTKGSLFDLLGRSPDQADALVVAVHGAFGDTFEISAGGF